MANGDNVVKCLSTFKKVAFNKKVQYNELPLNNRATIMNIKNLFKRKPQVQLNSGAGMLKMYLTKGTTKFFLPPNLSPEAIAVLQFIIKANMNQNFVHGFDRFQVITDKKYNLVYNLLADVVTGKQSMMDINFGCFKQINERDRQAYRDVYELCITLIVTSTEHFNDIYFPNVTAEFYT